MTSNLMTVLIIVIPFICQDDPDTLLKCLTIASEMLQGVTTKGLNPTLTTLVQTLVILKLFHHDNLTVLIHNKPITILTLGYPGCQRSSHSPAARSVR